MSTNSLNAAIAVDFSLIGTKLRALYKKETSGYEILLIPTLQSGNAGITIQELIGDITKLTKSVTGADSVNTEELTNALNGAVQEGTGQGGNGIEPEKIKVILKMAYLYICKKEEKESQLEYAFNLDVLTNGVIPKDLRNIVIVTTFQLSYTKFI